MTAKTHEALVGAQFGGQAQAYLQSSVHAQGKDLERLAVWLSDKPDAVVLDIGCGAGHASFAAAQKAAHITAYDLSENMLAVVRQAALERGLNNIATRQGQAEALPFPAASFDVVISRYSAHHWHDVGMALREVKRVLKPGGEFILMDIASPGQPVRDVWLQTVEMLRDPSHVHNYSQGEWLRLVNESGMTVQEMVAGRQALEFGAWVERMKTPAALVEAIRLLQQTVSDDVKTYFAIQDDGSFTPDTIMFRAR